MEKIKDFWAKFKSSRRLQIIVAVVLGLCLCIGVYGVSSLSSQTDENVQETTEEYSSAEEYVSALENKLSSVLSKISGAGDVAVIITLESGFSYTYATDTETKTTISGGTETTITTETLILVSDEPVVVGEVYPVIKGVVIVASGASDFSVKMNIISAAETALDVNTEKITVLS